MNEIAAVVVTYNRKTLLSECIEALLQQSYSDFDIWVIDNASTDGTKESIDKYIAENKIYYSNTGENLGGAGGFNYGLRLTCEKGYSRIWLMDDDTIPTNTALEKLVQADHELSGKYGFLSSTALWTDGSPCVMNRQKTISKWYENSQYLKYGLLRTFYATFVSFFIRAEVVKKIGLPIKDFFIWGDDVEYSNRISKKYPCFIAGESQVIHKIKDNNGSDISLDNGDRLNRYKYAYRNECVVARENGALGIIRQFFKVNYHILKVLRYSKNKKLTRIWIIISSTFEGIHFRPPIEYVE